MKFVTGKNNFFLIRLVRIKNIFYEYNYTFFCNKNDFCCIIYYIMSGCVNRYVKNIYIFSNTNIFVFKNRILFFFS